MLVSVDVKSCSTGWLLSKCGKGVEEISSAALITKIDGSLASAQELDSPAENMHSMLPLFYQSGYITIGTENRRQR